MARRFQVGWIIGAVGIAAVLTNVIGTAAAERGWRKYLRLIHAGSTGQATITKTGSASSAAAQYAFSVGGRSYYGAAPHCRARAGQRVEITYLPDAPYTSCLGSPGVRLADEVVEFLFGGLPFADQP